MSAKTLHIALPWHSLGHGNLGIDALTRSNMALLRRAADQAGRSVRFTTLCSSLAPPADTIPPDATVGPSPNLKPLLKGRSPFLALLRTADLVVDIGEGDSWADIYGGKRFAFHAGTKVAALTLGKPLVLAPQTIGPFNSPFRARVADAIMKRCRAVYARDNLSMQYLIDHGLRDKADEFIDVAFSLPFDAQPRGKTPGRVAVGLNVSGLLYRGGYTGRNELGLTIDYVAFTHQLIEALLARGDVDIHLIGHVVRSGGNDDDGSVIPDLIQRYPALRAGPEFWDASSAKTFMSGLDFVVGGRMHACIGAFSSGTPVVPIAYSRKFNGLFNTLGYPHFVDGRAVNTETALRQTMAAFDDRPRLASDIQAGLKVAHARLDRYVDAMADILAKLP